MKIFLDDNFLLANTTALKLYHEYAKVMPIIDYHNHLPPDDIATDKNFENITRIWLNGDHYKWRAMRANGVPEEFITGNGSDWNKFQKWSETVPFTLRNPLYHWTHLELQRYFGIHDILNADSAKKIYDECTAQLQLSSFSTRSLLKKFNVQFVGTTDDPLDDLLWHKKIKSDDFSISVCPSFRPDKAIALENTESFNSYLDKLEAVSGISVDRFDTYMDALKSRHDYFAENGCRAADHGLDKVYAEEFTEPEMKNIFNKARSGNNITTQEAAVFKSAMLMYIAEWNYEKHWVQQYHIGPLRNNNSKKFQELGPDTGWDSMGNTIQANHLVTFLDRLDRKNKLAKTILYSINPADYDVLATMAGNFNDGSYPGKIQSGAAWWFNDQEEGIIRHLNSISNNGLLSRFIGMLTDSRSFLSFPRHEYFRRILCNLLGEEVENGKLPNDENWLGKIVQDICFNNVKAYFNL